MVCDRAFDLGSSTNTNVTEWALPDQLVFSTVTALLRVASLHPNYSARATEAIISFIKDVVEQVHVNSGTLKYTVNSITSHFPL
jgi:hypothetical protein